MDSFEISGRGAIKRFVELAHSGPYDMLLPVAAAWDEMAQDADAGIKYSLDDFLEAGYWAVQDVVVTLDMVLWVAGLIEELESKTLAWQRRSEQWQALYEYIRTSGVYDQHMCELRGEIGNDHMRQC